MDFSDTSRDYTCIIQNFIKKKEEIDAYLSVASDDIALDLVILSVDICRYIQKLHSESRQEYDACQYLHRITNRLHNILN